MKSICNSLLNLLKGTLKYSEINTENTKNLKWEAIQQIFASPMGIINSMVTYCSLVEDKIITKGIFYFYYISYNWKFKKFINISLICI